MLSRISEKCLKFLSLTVVLSDEEPAICTETPDEFLLSKKEEIGIDSRRGGSFELNDDGNALKALHKGKVRAARGLNCISGHT